MDALKVHLEKWKKEHLSFYSRFRGSYRGKGVTLKDFMYVYNYALEVMPFRPKGVIIDDYYELLGGGLKWNRCFLKLNIFMHLFARTSFLPLKPVFSTGVILGRHVSNGCLMRRISSLASSPRLRKSGKGSLSILGIYTDSRKIWLGTPIFLVLTRKSGRYLAFIPDWSCRRKELTIYYQCNNTELL